MPALRCDPGRVLLPGEGFRHIDARAWFPSAANVTARSIRAVMATHVLPCSLCSRRHPGSRSPCRHRHRYDLGLASRVGGNA